MSTDTPLRIIVVDDDHWTVRGISATLDHAGDIDIVGTAYTGDAAVDLYAALHPDVVLMDVNMGPGLSGVDATAAICRMDPEARVVILSTVAPGPGLARAVDAGAVGVVHKSAPDAELIAAVHLAALEDSPPLVANMAAELSASASLLPELHIPVPRLTPRELLTLQLICEGLDYDEIAKREAVEITTVKAHARSLRQKLAASSLAQLVVRALQFHFIST